MKRFVVFVDRCEHNHFVEILSNANFNFRVSNNGNLVRIEITTSSKDNIPSSIRNEFLEVFTTQDVIDMGADLHDNKGFSRADIKSWLVALANNGLATIDVDKAFDIIVG